MTGFEQAYGELCEFVRVHGEIRVTPTSLSVPRDVRAAFYDRVEAVQRALACEVLDGQVAGAEMSGACGGDAAAVGACQEKAETGASFLRVAPVLGRVRVADLIEVAGKCAQVRAELCEKAGLAQFKLASMLEALMSDPAREVARPLFACVLDGLQAGASPSELRIRAASLLVPHADLLFRNAYEAWAYYGVVARLNPVRFHAVFTPDMKSVRTVPTDKVEVAAQPTSPTLRLPEAAFETADGRVFAMKTEAAHELDFYGFKNKRRRDSSAGGNTADLVTHRVLLLWEYASLDAVGFVADRDKSRLVPPALTVEVLDPADMATPAYVSAFVERIGAVRSRCAVQVIALDGFGGGRAQAGSSFDAQVREVAEPAQVDAGARVGRAEFPAGMLDDPTVPPVCVHHAEPAQRFDPALLDGIAEQLSR